MTDLSQHTSYTAAYSGLLNNFWLTIAIAGACLLGHEIGIRIPRRRGRDGRFRRVGARIALACGRVWRRRKRKKGGEEVQVTRIEEEKNLSKEELQKRKEEKAREQLGDRESWEFGHIYQPKVWALRPSPPVPRWPLQWVYTTLAVKERDMPDRFGLDLTVHSRFLRGCFFYTLLQCVTILPVLLPLHILYSPDDIARSSMIRASVTSLASSPVGQKRLWVHVVLMWWLSCTWLITILWVTWGAVGYRRREVRNLTIKMKALRDTRRQTEGGESGLNEEENEKREAIEGCEGIKRYRTLLVSNIPPDMRDEATLASYFDHYLNRHVDRMVQSGKPVPIPATSTSEPVVPPHPPSTIRKLLKRKQRQDVLMEKDGEATPRESWSKVRPGEDGEIEERESHVDEVILVKKLAGLYNLRSRRDDVLKRLEVAHVKLAQRVLKAVSKHKAKRAKEAEKDSDAERAAASGDTSETASMKDLADLTKDERLDMLVAALGHFVDDDPVQKGEGDRTVWEVLLSLPRELIDPYQSLTHLTSLFRDQNAPLIDYLTTKLALLTALLNEARSKPLESFGSASTAFVTFKDAKTSRLAMHVLESHPRRALACHTTPAPMHVDLLWPRLSRSVYRSEFVRGWVVTLGVWAFTLIWIFPVSLFCGLASLNNIAGFLKPLRVFLDAHPKLESVTTSLLPVILVALLTLAICPILLVIANKAETIVTGLGVHNAVLNRFWKFLMVNGVVFFSLGQAAITAYLTAWQNRDFDPLPAIAQAFPVAAPYFASYIMLQVAIQMFFEIFRLGLPTIVYVFGTRVSTIPRQRNSRTEHPTFSHFSNVPQHILAGTIMNLFAILNPLVIPFTLVFYGAAYLVWKRQFIYVYGRRYETNGRRSSIRFLRFSLDGLTLAQFVLFAFFILQKTKAYAAATGVLFPLTIIVKLIVTRALKRRFDDLDVEEADVLCPVRTTDDQPAGLPSEFGSSDEGHGQSPPAGSLQRLRGTIKGFIGKWSYATIPTRGPAALAERKPIPFDSTVFSTLDRKFTWPTGDVSEQGELVRPESVVAVMAPTPEPIRSEKVHFDDDEPDTLVDVVVPHEKLQPWEDIPPFETALGFNIQPAYTAGYDDFLWLPRDPLSTLDLDDTVEVRLSITTSAGGDGRIGDWPPAFDCSEGDSSEVVVIESPEEELSELPTTPTTPTRPSRYQTASPYTDFSVQMESPSGGSEHRLLGIHQIELPPSIGCEAGDVDDEDPAGGLRRSLTRAKSGLAGMFHRPRSATATSSQSGNNMSMQTLSAPSRTAGVPASPEAASVFVQTSPTSSRLLQPSDSRLMPPSPSPAGRPRKVSVRTVAFERRPSDSSSHERGSGISGATRSRSVRLPARSPSMLSHRTPGRTPSTSGRPPNTATHNALMNEVMEEERRAQSEFAEKHRKDQEAEFEEAEKAKEKRRRGSHSGAAADEPRGGGLFQRRYRDSGAGSGMMAF